jgi:hypothetical protein
MTRFLQALLLSAAIAGPTVPPTQGPQQNVIVSGATITWYGNIVVDPKDITKVPDPGSASGFRNAMSKITPPTINSDQIRITPNGRFGLGFKLIGSPPDAIVTLTFVTKFPLPGVPNASTGQFRLVDSRTYPGQPIGSDGLFAGRSFSDFANPPAGTWTIQVWYDNRLLVEKSFAVVTD